MKAKTKSRIALVACVLCVMAATILGTWLWCMQEAATNPDPNPMHVEDTQRAEDDPFPEVDWEYWQGINPDVIGWVTVPGTEIDLPIVQAPATDPTYYLYHDVYRNWNCYGCPYLDAECAELGFESPLALTFGHHMNDGSMFAEMASYSDASFMEGHREILLQTPERKYRLQVFAVDVVDSWNEFKQLQFENDDAFASWRENLLESADVVMDDGIDVANNDSVETNMFAFCTCSYGRWNGHERTIVYAVEKKCDGNISGKPCTRIEEGF